LRLALLMPYGMAMALISARKSFAIWTMADMGDMIQYIAQLSSRVAHTSGRLKIL
jgi:hypothetical protein